MPYDASAGVALAAHRQAISRSEGEEVTEPQRALTWSKKWHIVAENQSAMPEQYRMNTLIARCGTYLYHPDGPRFPAHLKAIIDGTRKSTGLCKTCAKSAKITEVKTYTEDQIRQVMNKHGVSTDGSCSCSWGLGARRDQELTGDHIIEELRKLCP